MPNDWKRACRAAGLVVKGDEVRVRLVEGREHRVRVSEAGDLVRFSSRVARPSVVRSADDLLLRIWLRNRGTKLVGFSIDERGWLVGEALAPRIGITDAEVALYVRTVAVESDRFEFLLTAQDVE